jgi:hypothetical protein
MKLDERIAELDERIAHERTVDVAAGLIRPLADVLADVEAFVRRFVVVTDAQAIALALWVAHTHAVDAAETTPYLAVTSAEKRSGKTRLLEVLELLVRAPVRASNMSDAVLFRLLAESTRTLLLDETDAVFAPKSDREGLRGLLNAGYRRGSPAWRMVGEGTKMRAEAFESFGPKVLAGIGGIPDTIADRAFPIRLKRKATGEDVERFRGREARAAAEPLRGALEAWNTEDADQLDAIRPHLPDELDDRAQDAAEPLLAIAELAGGEWPDRARRALVLLRSEQAGEDDETIGVRLLADTLAAFERTSLERLSTARLLELLCEDDEAPWTEYHGKPLTARGLARLLRPFSIRRTTVRLDDESVAKGYKREAFEDAWTRYLPSDAVPSVTSVTTAQQSQEQPVSKGYTEPLVTDTKQAANPHGYAVVTHVTDGTADTGGGGLPELVECVVCEGPLEDLTSVRCAACRSGA